MQGNESSENKDEVERRTNALVKPNRREVQSEKAMLELDLTVSHFTSLIFVVEKNNIFRCNGLQKTVWYFSRNVENFDFLNGLTFSLSILFTLNYFVRE